MSLLGIGAVLRRQCDPPHNSITDLLPPPQVDIEGTAVRVGGFAKGSGMIHPNMATMLALVTTDAAVAPPVWRDIVKLGVQRSFNQVGGGWGTLRFPLHPLQIDAQYTCLRVGVQRSRTIHFLWGHVEALHLC